jgi:hypothetical protein
MSTNPPSFRLPFALQDDFPDDVHPAVQEALRAINHAIRYSFNGLVDLNQAIPVLKAAIPAATAPAAAIPKALPSTIGTTNDQTGATAYTVQQSDYGALLVVNNAGGVAVTLNTGMPKPFYAHISNTGSGAATLTPTSGTVNGAGSYTLAAGASAHVYYSSLSDAAWFVA